MQSAAQHSLRSMEKLSLNSTSFEPINSKNLVHCAGYIRIDLDLDFQSVFQCKVQQKKKISMICFQGNKKS